jgi:hypothetical protein
MRGLQQFGAGSQASRAMTDGMYTALQEAGNLPDWPNRIDLAPSRRRSARIQTNGAWRVRHHPLDFSVAQTFLCSMARL